MSIFFDLKGNFQWVSITALISFIGILATVGATIYTSKKTIKANVRSTTKIEWINQIIELSAEFISSYQLIDMELRNIFVEKLKKAKNTISLQEDIITYDILEAKKYEINSKRIIKYNNNISEHAEKYNELVMRTSYISNQLLLYFMEEKECEISRNQIENLRQIIIETSSSINSDFETEKDDSYYQEKSDMLLKNLDILNKAIEEFRSSISGYLSTEWKKIEIGI